MCPKFFGYQNGNSVHKLPLSGDQRKFISEQMTLTMTANMINILRCKKYTSKQICYFSVTHFASFLKTFSGHKHNMEFKIRKRGMPSCQQKSHCLASQYFCQNALKLIFFRDTHVFKWTLILSLAHIHNFTLTTPFCLRLVTSP